MLESTISTIFNVTSGHKGQRETQVADGSFDGDLAVVLLFLSALIVTSNCLTILAISTTKVLKTLQNIFIIALAGADVFVGLGLLALLVQRHFRPPRRWIECQYSVAILYSSITLSLFIMVSVALDRYIYIVRPFFYRRHINAKRIKACLLVQWLLATAHGFMAAYLPRKEAVEKCNPLAAFQITFVKYMFPVVFCSVCTGIFILYGLIARTAKRHWDRRDRRLLNVTQTAASSSRAAGLGGKKDLLGPTGKVPIQSSAEGLVKLNEGEPTSTKPDHSSRVTSLVVGVNEFASSPEERSLMHEDRNCKSRQTENALIDSTCKLTNSDIGLFTDFDRDIYISMRKSADVDASKSKTDDTRTFPVDYVREKSEVNAERGDNIEIVCEHFETKPAKSATEPILHDASETFVPMVLGAKKQNRQIRFSKCSGGSRYSCPSNDRVDLGASRLSTVTLDASRDVKSNISMRSLKWLRLIIIVFGLFTICWSPTMLAILVSWMHEVSNKLSSVFAMLGLANSAVNFFVYALHTSQFRRAIFRRVTCRCGD